MGTWFRRTGFFVVAAMVCSLGGNAGPASAAPIGAAVSLTAASTQITWNGRASVAARVTTVPGYPLTGWEWLSIYDGSGIRIQACRGSSCTAGGPIPIYASRTYTAYLATDAPATSPPAAPYAVSNSVTVTNVGWVGSVTLTERPDTSGHVFDARASASLNGYPYHLSVYDEAGKYVTGCTYSNCTGLVMRPPAGSVKFYRAHVSRTPPLQGPPSNDVVAVSGVVMVTDLSDEEVLESPSVAAMIAALELKFQGSACLALGAVLPTHVNRSTVTDATLICNASGVKAAVAWLIAAVGIGVLASLLVASQAEPTIAPPAAPNPSNPTAPEPPPAPWGPPSGLSLQDVVRVTVGLLITAVTGPQTQPPPTEEQVETTVRQCMALLQAAGRSQLNAANECGQSRMLVVGGMPGFGKEAAEHNLEVISTVPSLVELEYMPEVEKSATGVPRGWYYSLPFSAACDGRLTSQHCDEYPFYSTVEGGPSAWYSYQTLLESRGASTLKPIDRSDNVYEGSIYSVMTQRVECGFTAPGADRHFLVIPLPDVQVPTFYLCPQ